CALPIYDAPRNRPYSALFRCLYFTQNSLISQWFSSGAFLDAPSKRGLYCGMAHLFAALSFIAALAFGFLAPEAQTPQRPSDRRNREVYVSVVDNSGKPVTGLTAADFRV